MVIRPGWDSPHVRCLPRTFCAWPCLLRQVGTVLGSPCDCIMDGITYANPGSRQSSYQKTLNNFKKLLGALGATPSGCTKKCSHWKIIKITASYKKTLNNFKKLLGALGATPSGCTKK